MIGDLFLDGGLAIFEKAKPSTRALLLSLIFGGWGGQFYNKQYLKGVAILLGQIVSVFLILFGIGFITIPLLWIGGTIDAYMVRKRMSRKRGDLRQMA